MKKTMAVLIAFVLSLFILPSALAAEGETFPYEIPGTDMTLTCRVLEDDTIEITGGQNIAGELVIPAEIDGKAVTGIGDEAFRNCTELTSVTISDSAITIGNWAFQGCAGLTCVSYSNTLPIDGDVFLGCDNIADVYVDGELLPRLEVPTKLVWGKEYLDDGSLRESNPGNISCYVKGGLTLYLNCTLYRVGEVEPVCKTIPLANKKGDYYECSCFFDSFEADGTYYCTIQAMGDWKTYSNSEVSEPSEYWEYVKPEAKLGTPTELRWDGQKGVWDDHGNQDKDGKVDMYDKDVLFAKTKEEVPKETGYDLYYDGTLAKEAIQEYGEGYYYFKIRAFSNDITKYQHSDWSELSPAYHFTMTPTRENLTSILTDAEDKTGAELREAVQDLNTGDLKTALLVDRNEEGGTADILRQLEEKTGVTVGVDAAEGFETLAETSIVGAALNDVPEGTDTITLNIAAPEQEHVIPTQYKNTVALSFSMGLDGVTAPEALKVPVKVTLPIPTTINRSFLVLLHYGQDGSVEEIAQPYQFQKDGKWYVSIVLTHFSDFVMTETVQKEEGNKPSGGNSGGGSGGGSSSTPTTTPTPSGSDTPADTTPTEDIPSVDETPAFVAEEAFDDIAKAAWYYDAVEFVAGKGLMNGTGNKQFAPDEYITRASVAQILYNSEENHDTAISNPFVDVARGSWYEDAVVWAAEQGIVTGFNANTFGPDGLITREQFAVMLWRHAGKPDSDFSLEEFADTDTAGEYAVSALKWAVENGIIQGAGDGTLAPLRNATRAETAQMLMRYFK